MKVEMRPGRAVTRNLSDELNLQKPMVRTEIRRHFFSHRIIEPWNRLPAEIKHSPNTKIFKSRLNKWME